MCTVCAIGFLIKDKRKGGVLYRQSSLDLNGRSISFDVLFKIGQSELHGRYKVAKYSLS